MMRIRAVVTVSMRERADRGRQELAREERGSGRAGSGLDGVRGRGGQPRLGEVEEFGDLDARDGSGFDVTPGGCTGCGGGLGRDQLQDDIGLGSTGGLVLGQLEERGRPAAVFGLDLPGGPRPSAGVRRDADPAGSGSRPGQAWAVHGQRWERTVLGGRLWGMRPHKADVSQAMAHRGRRNVVFVVVTLALLSACASAATTEVTEARATTTQTPEPGRHASGLLVRGPGHPPAIPPALADSYGFAQQISESNPDAFSPPWVDTSRMEVVLGVVTAYGTQVLADLAAGRIRHVEGSKPYFDRTPEGVVTQSATVSRFLQQIQVQPVDATRSKASLEALSNAVIDLGDDPRFDTVERPFQSGIDETVGHVVLSVMQLTDALAAEIVRLYGTELVEVQVDPNHIYPTAM